MMRSVHLRPSRSNNCASGRAVADTRFDVITPADSAPERHWISPTTAPGSGSSTRTTLICGAFPDSTSHCFDNALPHCCAASQSSNGPTARGPTSCCPSSVSTTTNNVDLLRLWSTGTKLPIRTPGRLDVDHPRREVPRRRTERLTRGGDRAAGKRCVATRADRGTDPERQRPAEQQRALPGAEP